MDDLEEQFNAIVDPVMEQFIADVEADVKESVGTPYPPSSVPGEKPHKRSGRLQSEITSLVRTTPTSIIGEVASEAPYSTYLENNLDRAFMGPAQHKWGPILIERLNQALGK